MYLRPGQKPDDPSVLMWDARGLAFNLVRRSPGLGFNKIDYARLNRDVGASQRVYALVDRYEVRDSERYHARRRLNAAEELELDLAPYEHELAVAQDLLDDAVEDLKRLAEAYPQAFRSKGWNGHTDYRLD